MRVEFDQHACSGWFQCVQHWDAFEMDIASGVANFQGAEEIEDGLFEREVSTDEEAVKAAAESCPVDAIVVYDDGNQLVPEP